MVRWRHDARVQRSTPVWLGPTHRRRNAAARLSSPELPCGDHVWCGAIVAHANGSIYSVHGSHLHRLDPVDLSVLAERRLPVDRAHNGLLVLSDGTLATKDLRLEGQGGTTISRFEPERLDLIDAPLVLPEGSILIIRTTSNQSNRSASVVVESSRPRSMFPNTQWRLLGIRSTAGSPAFQSRPNVDRHASKPSTTSELSGRVASHRARVRR